MRGILFLLAILTFTTACSHCQLNRRADPEPVEDYVAGILEGIHEQKSVEGLKKCMGQAQQLLDKMKAAIELMKQFKIDALFQGLSMLFEALSELEDMLDPCLEEYTQFQKLMDAMESSDINAIIMKIMSNPLQFVADILECMRAFEHQRWHIAGKYMGTILYNLFLVELSRPQLDPIEFIKGFLEGLNEKGDINELLKCVKDLEHIVNKIIEAVGYIQHMDPANLIKGITLLLEAVTELMNSLAPCASGFEQIKKLIDAIAHVDIMKLVFKILANPGPFISDVMDAVDAFNKGDFHRAGKDIGDVLYRMFLASLQDGIDPVEFIKGLLEGLNEKGDINELLKCVKNIESIVNKIIEAIGYIKQKDPMNLIKGITMLIEAVTELMNVLAPCASGFEQIKKLIDAITHIDIMKLVFKILADPSPYIADVMDAIEAFNSGDFHRAGKDIGDLLYRMFLSSQLVLVNLDPIEFIKGLLEGLNEKGDINELLKCVKDIEHIVLKIMEAIEYIKKMDPLNLIKGITMLLEAVTELMNSLAPCASGFEQIKKLIDAISHLDIMKLVFKILGNPSPFIADVMDAIDAFNAGDSHRAGRDIGDLLYKMFLEAMMDKLDPIDFIKGFLEGLNEKGDINELLKCVKNFEHIITKIIEAIGYIQHMDPMNLIKGITMLLEAVTELMNSLAPCASGFEQIKKLIDAIAHIDIMKLVFKILANPGAFIADITDAIAAFNSQDFHRAGKDIGDLLFKMFLEGQ